MSLHTDILFSLFSFPTTSKIQSIHILPYGKNITCNTDWFSVELHIGNTARLFAAAEGATEGRGRRGRSESGPCQSRMKRDHPGWRQELGRGSGEDGRQAAWQPVPGAAGAWRQSGLWEAARAGRRYAARSTKATSASHSITLIWSVCGGNCLCVCPST